ncbi:hypothetical protein [Amycolatopsis sp. WQ 127309]|uniref:hypothetical protein n=1 Tax=Amycolatopsis sp. WQ 127309 TaxID=2932773 RepID=UPI001FF49E70|nr:hypothetical protein [Amycolatopsis sp. WQ 127309]UOZ08472.1 hypothetical protein MUY22_09430 [Amycolatopsis sp. WQ 127309]
MVIMTDAMRELATRAKLDTVTSVDLPPRAGELLDAGWVREGDGAWVLAALRRSYSGRRAAFDDLTGYEAAVNGRAVYDLDFPRGEERAARLLRRACAVSRAALDQLRSVPDAPVVTALITISRSFTEDPEWVGSQTFWAEHEGEQPYVEIDGGASDELLMSMSSRFPDSVGC